MRVGAAHLTYCTNIHPGESWSEVEHNVATHVIAVKQRVSPDAPFGVGLRLSERAARELAAGPLPAFKAFLAAHGLYVFTINGFPYGTFHGTAVKEAVYRPDWLEEPRVDYTHLLATILAELLPAGMTGTISTVPGCFRARTAERDAATAVQRNVCRVAATLAAIEQRTGKRIVLALEPEPACMIETIDEAIAFFARMPADARRHVGLCLDACHAAVEFEQLPGCIARLRAAGVEIAKVQLSAGLQIAPVDVAQRAALARYLDAVYLHQVVVDGTQRYVDLPDALADAPAGEWRVHFHVPVFHKDLGAFTSTQDFLAALLALHRRDPISTHLEVETYTWDVLPPELRGQPIADAIARELTWVLERLA